MAQSFRQLAGLPPNTASTADSVLVIIDAQNEYDYGHLATYDVGNTRAAITTLLNLYRSASAPIYHIVQAMPPGCPVFTPSTPLAAEFPELEPLASEPVIPKVFPSSFTKTTLHEEIEKTGRKKIVLCGYMAHVCVSTTARAGPEFGYEVVVVREAVGDRDIPGVDAKTLCDVALKEVDDAFGTVVGLSEIK